MLNYQGLVGLARTLKDRTVLSVYINGDFSDPAQRRRWRIELRHALDDIARWLAGSSHEEREDFAARRALIEARLDGLGASVRAPGWAGFYTRDGEHEAGPLPVSVPTLAIWSTGPCLAPYIRALKEARPVVVALVDHRSVEVYRYAGLVAKHVESLKSRVRSEERPHMARPARMGFHQGTRGPTAADAVQRDLNTGAERMLSDLAGRLTRHVSSDGWVVLGGIPTMASAALAHLPTTLRARTVSITLDVHASPAQVAEAARAAASDLRSADDLNRINETLASVESDLRGAAGSVDTLRALHEGSVRELFFTEAFLRDHAADAESAVRLALEQHAFVEQVSGAAATTLDAVGGVAARLRFPSAVTT